MEQRETLVSRLGFVLIGEFSKLVKHGLASAITAAMGQAFFTLSTGIGSMAIFSSYVSRNHRLFGESISITAFDTGMALLSGLIIFSACFSFGVNPDSSSRFIFVTLPNIFNSIVGVYI